MKQNIFEELSQVDCSKHVEKKGKFSYLSWTHAVSELLKRHPEATWDTKRFEGMPFMSTSAGVFVEVGVTVNGIERTQIHPVLNHQNKPIPQPSSFEIFTSIQRALVKAIALHGLGLYIYAGEDLPEQPEVSPLDNGQIKTIRDALGALQLTEDDLLQAGNFQVPLTQIHADKYENIMDWLNGQQQQEGMDK